MSGQTLRQRYMRRFSGLEKNSRRAATIIVGGYVAQILAAIAAGHWALKLESTPAQWVGVGALMILIATRMRGLNNIVHECSHATFAKERADNVLLGSIAATCVLGSYTDYREEHLTHHAHLGDYDHDMDLHGLRDLRLHDPLTMRTVLRHLITPLIGRHLPYYLSANLSARDGRGFQAAKCAIIAAALAYLAVAPFSAVMMVFVPFVLLYSSLNYWTDCFDHAGLVASEDELDSSRNMLAPRPLRVMFFPRNDCFHLVHHLFPHVPSKHLEACHNVLEQDTIYARKLNASVTTIMPQPSGAVIPAE